MQDRDIFSIVNNISVNFPALVSILSFLLFFYAFVYVFYSNSKKTQEIKLFLFFDFLFSVFCLGQTFLHSSSGDNIQYLYFFNIISAIGYCFYFSAVLNFFAKLANVKKASFDDLNLIKEKKETYNNILEVKSVKSYFEYFFKKTGLKVFGFTRKLSFIFSSNIFIFISYIVSFVLFFSILSGINVPNTYNETPIGGYVDVPNVTNPYFYLYITFLPIWMLSIIAINIYLKLRFSINGDVVRRKQINIIFYSGLFTIITGLTSNHLFPIMGLNLPPLGSLFEGIWVYCIALSITKYKFIQEPKDYAQTTIVDESQEAIANVDLYGFITYSNQKFNSIFNNVEKINNTKIDYLLSSSSCNDFTITFNELVSIDKNFPIEFFMSCEDKKMYFNLTSQKVVVSGFVIGYTIKLIDITTIKNQNEILEEAVKRATKELLEAKNEAVRRLEITEKYTRRSIVDLIEIGQDPTRINPEKREMAVMFADIRDFTAISEKLKPEQITELLNLYFEVMNSCIIDNHGEIDKIIGDEVMALFDNPIHAINASIEIRKKLPNLNDQLFKKYKIKVNNGIGINFGEVVRGNIGSSQKMDLTVIGDVVNSASRTEGLTKYYSLPILVSEEVLNSVKKFKDKNTKINQSEDFDVDFLNISLNSPDYKFRFIDRVKVKGRDEPINIYEIFDYERNDIVIMKEGNQSRLEEAFSFYKQGDFKKSLEIYRSIAADMPRHNYDQKLLADPVISFFIDRCNKLNEHSMKNPSFLKKWDGINRFNNK